MPSPDQITGSRFARQIALPHGPGLIAAGAAGHFAVAPRFIASRARRPLRHDSFLRLFTLGICVALCLAWAPALLAADANGEPLLLEDTIALENVSGRIDHMAIDIARSRLWIAELGNNTVDVLDLAQRRVIHRIEGLSEPQGLAVADGTVAIANGGNGTVALLHADDFSLVERIQLGDDADNVRADPTKHRMVAGYGQGALATIDLATKSRTGDIPLAAHPEGFQLAGDGSRAFVNIPGARQIAVIDMAGHRQIATWETGGFRSNFPMAIDESGSTLAVVFRHPARLALIDTANGKIRNDIEACGDADDVFFDSIRQRIYVSCGQGYIDVIAQGNAAPKRLARIATSAGARTSLYVPQLDRLFVAAPGGVFAGKARILVYRPAPGNAE